MKVLQIIKDWWGTLGAILTLLVGIFLEIPEFTITLAFILFLFFVAGQITTTQIQLYNFRNTHPNVVAEGVTPEKPFPLWIGRSASNIMVERYYLPFRNTKLKGIRIADTDPIHAKVSFYNMDCMLLISHEKPFWGGSPAAYERPLEYKVILEANGKPEELCLIAKQQGMRPLYVFSDDSYIPGRKSIKPFRNELELTNDKYYIRVQLDAGNLDIEPVWILLSNRGEHEKPDFDFVDSPCKSKGL